MEFEEIRHTGGTARASLHFLGTERNALRLAFPIIMLQLCLPPTIGAQGAIQPPTNLRIISSDGTDRTNASQSHAIRFRAVALRVFGKCDYSEDGVAFTNFERGHVFDQCAIIRTGEEGRADLFFRRSGTIIRLQAGTEIRLERITISSQDGHPSNHTLLDLRAGRIFTVVRSALGLSTLEISNAAGRSVLEGSGGGSYIIAADGTHVSALGSVAPLKLIATDGIFFIAAGQQFTRQDGKTLPLARSSFADDLAQLDELQASPDASANGQP
jgi:hypothetical protein